MSKVYEVNQDMQESVKRGYEATDIKLRPVVMLLVILTVAGVIGHLVLWGLHTLVTNRLEAGDPAPPPVARQDQTPPEPRLQTAPRLDWETMIREHNQRLNSYGWADQPGGAVRIPIEQAIRLTAERGLPVRPDPIPFPQSPNVQESDDLESEGGQPPDSDARTRPQAEDE